MDYNTFSYKNYKMENSDHKLLIILIISGVLLLFLILFPIFFIRKRKIMKSENNDLNKKVLNNEIEPIE